MINHREFHSPVYIFDSNYFCERSINPLLILYSVLSLVIFSIHSHCWEFQFSNHDMCLLTWTSWNGDTAIVSYIWVSCLLKGLPCCDRDLIVMVPQGEIMAIVVCWFHQADWSIFVITFSWLVALGLFYVLFFARLFTLMHPNAYTVPRDWRILELQILSLKLLQNLKPLRKRYLASLTRSPNLLPF